MAIKREHFQRGFTKFPRWTCPTCQAGVFKPMKDTQKVIETGPSKADHNHEAWEPDWITKRFIDLLRCENISCRQIAAVSGETSHFLATYYDNPFEEPECDLVQTFIPKAIIPAPAIFMIPTKTPEELKCQLHKAFSLFWVDLEACAGRIRVCIELLMDDLKIPTIGTNKKGKEYEMSLHARIKEYGTDKQETVDFLLAVKWIGNQGSHASLDELNRDDLLDVFEFVEFVLEENYVGGRQRLVAKAIAINKAKGKPKP